MNFREILEAYNVRIAPASHQHTRPGWINFDCPFCLDGKGKFHMGYSMGWKYVHCWKSGKHQLLETLVALTGVPRGKAREMLTGLASVAPGPREQHRGTLRLPAYRGPLQNPHLNYLKARGLDPDVLRALWGIEGIGIAPRLQWRIFIPWTHMGEVVSWTTRSIRDEGQRYISAKPEEEVLEAKRTLLFGEDYCRHSIVVVEGPFDVFRIGPGAAAIFGLGATSAQINRIASFPLRVVCFDTESDAQRRAGKLCDALSIFGGETINVRLDSKDPGEATDEEIATLRSYLR